MGDFKFDRIKDNWGVKGLGDGNHLTHELGSSEFHLTTPIGLGDGLGTLKLRDHFDSNGLFKFGNLDITDKE